MNEEKKPLEVSRVFYGLYSIYIRHLNSKTWTGIVSDIKSRSYSELSEKEQKYVRDIYHNLYKNEGGDIYYWLSILIDLGKKYGSKTETLKSLEDFKKDLDFEKIFLEKYLNGQVISARESQDFINNFDAMRNLVNKILEEIEIKKTDAKEYIQTHEIPDSIKPSFFQFGKKTKLTAAIALAAALGFIVMVQDSKEADNYKQQDEIHQYQDEVRKGNGSIIGSSGNQSN